MYKIFELLAGIVRYEHTFDYVNELFLPKCDSDKKDNRIQKLLSRVRLTK